MGFALLNSVFTLAVFIGRFSVVKCEDTSHTLTYVKNNEGQIKDRLLSHPNYSSTARPVFDDRITVDVVMSLQIYAMLDLNERDQVITTASWMRLRWRDPRLQWNTSEFGGVNYINMQVDEIWTPQLFIGNALDSDGLSVVSDRGSIIVQADGAASLGTPLVQKTQCPINIRYFPFDTQACPFYVFPLNLLEERLHLFTTTNSEGSEINSREWSLVNLSNHGATQMYTDFSPDIPVGNISLGVFCLVLKRNPSHYIRILWLPSTVLCLMTCVTFVAPPDSGERISLGVSMVLGLTVFQLLIADILPTASEDSPILGTYLSVNFLMACLVLPVSLMNISIAFGDSRVFLLKYTLTRRLFLEYLPRMGGIPSYSQRISDLGENAGEMPNINQVEDSSKDAAMKCESMKKIHQDGMSHAEKTKIELRTVALVMDRLAILGFLVAFLVYLLITLLAFMQNAGVHEDVRYTCGLPLE